MSLKTNSIVSKALSFDPPELISFLKDADIAYANGNPLISDADYDLLKEKAENESPDHEYFSQVGVSSAAIVDYQTGNHEVMMGSLKKLRPMQAADFIERHKEINWGVFPKLDGISLSLLYRKGHFKQALTRGTGTVGEDVTAWVLKIPSIPKTLTDRHGDEVKDDFIIMGEAIISRRNFENVKDIGYKNARNAVSGIFRKKDFDTAHERLLEQVDMPVWRIWHSGHHGWEMQSEKGRIDLAEAWGFSPLHNHVDERGLSEASLTAYIHEITNPENAYACDGVVAYPMLTEEKALLGDLNTKLPDWGFSVKLLPHYQYAQTGSIGHIKWEQSIRGLYSPVCVLKEPLVFDGVTVTNISMQNYGFVKRTQAGPGSQVKVIRSGDVIPYILSCTAAESMDVPETCQHCGSNLLHDNVNLYCENESCLGVAKKRFAHFLKCLDIKGISDETAEALWNAGLTSAEKIVRAARSSEDHDLAEIIGPSRAGKLVKGIQSWKPSQAELAYASGLFNSLTVSLGVKRLELLFEEGVQAEGIGEIIADFFNRKRPVYDEWASGLPISAQKKVTVEGPFSGMSFAFTGFRNKQMEHEIVSLGGKVESVKKSTTVLFGEPGSTKAAKAEKYGVPIIAPSDIPEEILSGLNEGKSGPLLVDWIKGILS